MSIHFSKTHRGKAVNHQNKHPRVATADLEGQAWCRQQLPQMVLTLWRAGLRGQNNLKGKTLF